MDKIESIPGLIDELRRLKHMVEETAAASRERSLVLTRLDEAELWLGWCRHVDYKSD